MGRSKREHRNWTESRYVEAYKLARSGMTNNQIRQIMGVSSIVFKRWRKEKPAFQEALDLGRSTDTGSELTFADYVFERLSPELQDVWNHINSFQEDPNFLTRIESLFQEKGKRVQQHMFMYAWLTHNFDVNTACRVVGVSKNKLDSWIQNDPEFKALLDQINWHKGNFFEQGLLDLVKSRDSSAVIFANKTFNRERGYDQKLMVEVSGRVDHVQIPLESLDLPVEVMQVILEKMREHQQKALPFTPDPANTLEVTPTVPEFVRAS